MKERPMVCSSPCRERGAQRYHASHVWADQARCIVLAHSDVAGECSDRPRSTSATEGQPTARGAAGPGLQRRAETFGGLAGRFGISTATVWRYVSETHGPAGSLVPEAAPDPAGTKG